MALERGDEGGQVARVRNQQVPPAQAEEQQQVRGEREDVIERQRGDHGFLALLEHRARPGEGLAHVRRHVGVRERRALRPPGGAAGVLEERHVFRTHGGRGKLRRARVVERDRAGNAPCGHHALHVLHREVHRPALRRGERVAHLRRDHVPHARAGERVLDGVREVLQHDDRRGARVLELEAQLGGGVQRIHVHHRESGAQRADERDGVLQQVRQHERDALARREREVAPQISAERGRATLDLAVGERDAHAGERGALAPARAAALEERLQRLRRRRACHGARAGR